jgi:hypothetical protein
MPAESKPPSRRESLIVAAGLFALGTFYVFDVFAGNDGGPPAAGVLLMCLSLYAGSGLFVLRAFAPTSFSTAPVRGLRFRHWLTVILIVLGAVALGCIGLLNAVSPMVGGTPATGEDLWFGRILFGGMSFVTFGFAAWVLVRAALVGNKDETPT